MRTLRWSACTQGFDRKKRLVTPSRLEAVGYLKTEHDLSERRACEAVLISRRVYRHSPQHRDDAALVEALGRLARDHPDLEFGKFCDLLKAEGRGWNHKRVHRVYCAMKLNKRRKYKR